MKANIKNKNILRQSWYICFKCHQPYSSRFENLQYHLTINNLYFSHQSAFWIVFLILSLLRNTWTDINYDIYLKQITDILKNFFPAHYHSYFLVSYASLGASYLIYKGIFYDLWLNSKKISFGKIYGNCEVRTHADFRPVDLKSTPLTSRASYRYWFRGTE